MMKMSDRLLSFKRMETNSNTCETQSSSRLCHPICHRICARKFKTKSSKGKNYRRLQSLSSVSTMCIDRLRSRAQPFTQSFRAYVCLDYRTTNNCGGGKRKTTKQPQPGKKPRQQRQ